MDFITIKKKKDSLVEFSRNNLGTLKLIKLLDRKLYLHHLAALIITYTLLIILLVGILRTISGVNGDIFIIIAVFGDAILMITFKKILNRKHQLMPEIQRFRVNSIRRFFLDNSYCEIEIDYIKKELFEEGISEKKSNLRLTAALAILLLPLWEYFVSGFIDNASGSEQLSEVLLKVTVVIVIIALLIVLFVYIEGRILNMMNKGANMKTNLSKLSELVVMEEVY